MYFKALVSGGLLKKSQPSKVAPEKCNWNISRVEHGCKTVVFSKRVEIKLSQNALTFMGNFCYSIQIKAFNLQYVLNDIF
jgi:hypothetical protein